MDLRQDRLVAAHTVERGIELEALPQRGNGVAQNLDIPTCIVTAYPLRLDSQPLYKVVERVTCPASVAKKHFG